MSGWKDEFGAEYAVPAALDAMVEAGTLADQSWHNDVAPSFTLVEHEHDGDLWDDGLPRLWVNHPDRENREYENAPRFLVTGAEVEDEALYEGEDLDAALAALRAARPAVYVPVEEDDVRGALRGLLRLFREIDAGEHDDAPEIVRARAVLGEA